MVHPIHIMQPLKLKQICINLDGRSWYFFKFFFFSKESLKKVLSEKKMSPRGIRQSWTH